MDLMWGGCSLVGIKNWSHDLKIKDQRFWIQIKFFFIWGAIFIILCKEGLGLMQRSFSHRSDNV